MENGYHSCLPEGLNCGSEVSVATLFAIQQHKEVLGWLAHAFCLSCTSSCLCYLPRLGGCGPCQCCLDCYPRRASPQHNLL